MGRCGSMGMGQCANGTERGRGVFVYRKVHAIAAMLVRQGILCGQSALL